MIEVEYTAQMRALDAVIAKATGWRVVPQSDHKWKLVSPNANEYLHYPDDECPWDDVPRYHADRDELADALRWAAREQTLWLRFEKMLFAEIVAMNKYFLSDIQAALLASPYVIAAALAQAIEREGEK